MRTDLSAYDEKGEKVFSNIEVPCLPSIRPPTPLPSPKSSTVIPELYP